MPRQARDSGADESGVDVPVGRRSPLVLVLAVAFAASFFLFWLCYPLSASLSEKSSGMVITVMYCDHGCSARCCCPESALRQVVCTWLRIRDLSRAPLLLLSTSEDYVLTTNMSYLHIVAVLSFPGTVTGVMMDVMVDGMLVGRNDD